MNPLLKWIEEQIESGITSPNAIATKTGFSKTFYYNVMSGRVDVGYNFCKGVSNAMGEPLEKMLRLAGLLERPRNSLTQSIIDEINYLDNEEAEEVLAFIQFKKDYRKKKAPTLYRIDKNHSHVLGESNDKNH